MPDNTNNNDDSVMTFRGLGEMLQSGLFQAVGGVFSLLTENKPLEKLLFTFYGLVRDIQEDKLDPDDDTKQLVDDLIQAASKAGEILESQVSKDTMEQALVLLREAYEILRKRDPEPTWEELETAHTKLVDALEPIYTGSIEAYLKTPHTLVEVAFILSGVFLNPFQMDYEELEKELSSIGDKYAPFLESRADFDILPALGNEAEGQLSTAITKLQWVSGQIAGGNIERSTLSVPIRAAYNTLLIAGKEEIERLLEELLPAADSLLGGVLEIFMHTGDQTLADEIMEAMGIVIVVAEMVNWCTFSADSLQYKGELITLLLEEVQQYLEEHHDESRLITAICNLLDFIQEQVSGSRKGAVLNKFPEPHPSHNQTVGGNLGDERSPLGLPGRFVPDGFHLLVVAWNLKIFPATELLRDHFHQVQLAVNDRDTHLLQSLFLGLKGPIFRPWGDDEIGRASCRERV